jgi:hypothetical protein
VQPKMFKYARWCWLFVRLGVNLLSVSLVNASGRRDRMRSSTTCISALAPPVHTRSSGLSRELLCALSNLALGLYCGTRSWMAAAGAFEIQGTMRRAPAKLNSGHGKRPQPVVRYRDTTPAFPQLPLHPPGFLHSHRSASLGV